MLTARLNDMLGMVPADDFLFVAGLRTKYVLFVDNTREIDNLVGRFAQERRNDRTSGNLPGDPAADACVEDGSIWIPSRCST